MSKSIHSRTTPQRNLYSAREAYGNGGHGGLSFLFGNYNRGLQLQELLSLWILW